ncbi:MAG: PAS domain S-box protein [Alphaproteobacteria bacterium]|nr:PAS domain S-box protein [Alphaproteobacteria bacterium]MBT4966592.1 PAS domain S-box protein [Alphaproteobacteria bacterium]MBT5161728.1 PAS domain S-box protein [Alphaproteobacteria bacterium]MBT7746734.1 PAS domain S-box protein [Alphaproteobacteria bacterium]
MGIYSDLVVKLGRHFASLVEPVSKEITADPGPGTYDNFKNIVERSILGVVVNRIDRSPLYANQRCADLFGYDSPEDILKLQNTLELASRTDAARIAETRDRDLLAGNSIATFEFEGLRKDGSIIPLYAKSTTTTWQGKAARVVMFIELEGMREAEFKHAESEERFRQFATISSDWFWELDQNLKATFVSDTSDTDGAPLRGDMTNRSPREVYSKLSKHPTYDAFIQKLDDHEVISKLNIFRHRDGYKDLWLQINARPIFDDQKNFMGYRGTTNDVTDAVQAVEALRASEERFNRATRGAKVTIWDWDMETNEYYVSGEAARLYGYTDKNMPHTRDDWNALVHPDDMEGYTNRFLAHIKGETEIFEYEYRLRCADGSYNHVSVQGSAQRDTMGRATGISGWGMDVTEQRNTERLLAEAIDSLSEGFALYDEQDKLIAFNQQYAEIFTTLGVTIKIGQTFEANVRRGLELRAEIEGSVVDEQELQSLVRNHLDPPPYGERQLHDDRWIRTTEVKTPSGGVAGLRTDITGHRHVLDRLAKSEERFRYFADIASDWHFETDKDLRYIFLSDGVIHDSGIDPEEFIGQTHEEVFGDLTRHSTHQKYIADLDKHQALRDALLCREGTDQKISWSRINLTPKHDQDGEFDGYYGSGRDVTEQMEAQQFLAQKEAQVSGMLEIAPDAIIAIGSDMGIQIFNQGATDVFGYSEEEILGKPTVPDLIG